MLILFGLGDARQLQRQGRVHLLVREGVMALEGMRRHEMCVLMLGWHALHLERRWIARLRRHILCGMREGLLLWDERLLQDTRRMLLLIKVCVSSHVHC